MSTSSFRLSQGLLRIGNGASASSSATASSSSSTIIGRRGLINHHSRIFSNSNLNQGQRRWIRNATTKTISNGKTATGNSGRGGLFFRSQYFKRWWTGMQTYYYSL